MKQTPATKRLPIDQLRIGMYVHLDLGWMAHPFPLSHFRISTDEQIRIIGTLGLESVRVEADPHEPAAAAPSDGSVARDGRTPSPLATHTANATPILSEATSSAPSPDASVTAHRQALAEQREALQLCQHQFAEASEACARTSQLVRSDPRGAGDEAKALAGAMVDKMLAGPEVCIRMLTGHAGEQPTAHAMNVTVLSLLLARSFGLPRAEMLDLGVGALLHDVGKLDLPESVAHRDASFSPQEVLAYEDHVAHGVAHARRMGLPVGALLVIAQHHEHADGTGFPMHVTSDRITAASRIVAMVNRYDNLVNPHRPGPSLTPHEALSTMFAQSQAKFDTSMLGAFIKMMGVYPPGSTVQLTDDRHALVMSVNAARPLKPRVLVADPKVPREQALIVDLEKAPGLGIRRCLKPMQLPSAAFDYLQPRPRVSYFFEQLRALVPPLNVQLQSALA